MIAPRLKPTVDVRRTADGRILILRADLNGQDMELEGDSAWIGRFLELLDGRRGPEDLQAALAEDGYRATSATVHEALDELASAGLIDDAASDRILDGYTAERYSRQLAYFADLTDRSGGAAVAQQRLSQASVCILGVGGLGSWAAYGLACAGVGHLILVDGDRLELSNLNRQVLYSEAALGGSKAELAAQRLQAFSERATVEPIVRRLASLDDVSDVIAGADLVIDAADSPAHLIDRWVNQACFAAEVPYIAMSQSPPKIRIGPLYAPGQTGCYHCLEQNYRDCFADYDLLAESAPTSSIAATFGAACGAVGSLVAAEAVHFLTGLTTPTALACAITFDLRDLTSVSTPVRQRADCPVCARPAARTSA
jgi:bacteriocin biosynthesis cyclodehydratase domain-containing protein